MSPRKLSINNSVNKQNPEYFAALFPTQRKHELASMEKAKARSDLSKIDYTPELLDTFPALVDYTPQIPFVREQGGWGCGMFSMSACWDIMNELVCAHSPNISVNRQLWARNLELRGELIPASYEKYKANYRTMNELLVNFGCPTEGTELTNSDAVCWPFPEGDSECANLRVRGRPDRAGSTLTSTTYSGDPRVYYLAADCHIYELAWYGDSWHYRNVSRDSGGEDAIATMESALASTTCSGNPRIYYLAPDYNVHELSLLPDGWHHGRVSLDAGAPPPTKGSALTATTCHDTPRVYYLTADCHVHELAWYDGGWHHRNVSLDAGAPPAIMGSALTATTSSGDPRVYYFGIDPCIHELAWYDGGWHHRNVLLDAGAPPAIIVGPIASTIYSGDTRVYYLAGDCHVHELAWYGGGWHHRNVSLDTGAPPAIIGSALTATTFLGNLRIYYLASDYHVHELGVLSDGWHHRVISLDAKAPPAVGGSPLTYTTSSGDPRVYYVAEDYHVHELAFWDVDWNHRIVSLDAGGPQAITGGFWGIMIPVKVELDNLRFHLTQHPLRIGVFDNKHFVALIGYDDNKKLFKFINSWGDQWSDNKWLTNGDGFGYIKYEDVNKEIYGAEYFEIVHPKPVAIARVKFQSDRRQDVLLWLRDEGKNVSKQIWPNGQREDDSRNLTFTVPLPKGFAWPPSNANGLSLIVLGTSLHSPNGGKIIEFTAAKGNEVFKCKQLQIWPVPFVPNQTVKLTIP